VRRRLGLFKTLGAEEVGMVVARGGLDEDEDGGRRGRGDAVRKVDDDAVPAEVPANTEDKAGLDFIRVGIVRRRAAALAEGVEGRVGGTLYSKRETEFLWDLARDAAVGSSYRAVFDPPATALEPDA
jgi:hypothetical protein